MLSYSSSLFNKYVFFTIKIVFFFIILVFNVDVEEEENE